MVALGLSFGNGVLCAHPPARTLISIHEPQCALTPNVNDPLRRFLRIERPSLQATGKEPLFQFVTVQVRRAPCSRLPSTEHHFEVWERGVPMDRCTKEALKVAIIADDLAAVVYSLDGDRRCGGEGVKQPSFGEADTLKPQRRKEGSPRPPQSHDDPSR